MRGIFAIDPGKQTGVAWGIFEETADTVADAMRTSVYVESTTVEGTELEQARILFELWQHFKTTCVQNFKLKPEQVDLVIEDFSLIPGAHAGGKEGIAPARIGWAFEGFRQGRASKYRSSKHVSDAIWQLPGATRNRRHLKNWGVWVVGKEHERAAFCHVGERLRKLMR